LNTERIRYGCGLDSIFQMCTSGKVQNANESPTGHQKTANPKPGSQTGIGCFYVLMGRKMSEASCLAHYFWSYYQVSTMR